MSIEQESEKNPLAAIVASNCNADDALRVYDPCLETAINDFAAAMAATQASIITELQSANTSLGEFLTDTTAIQAQLDQVIADIQAGNVILGNIQTAVEAIQTAVEAIDENTDGIEALLQSILDALDQTHCDRSVLTSVCVLSAAGTEVANVCVLNEKRFTVADGAMVSDVNTPKSIDPSTGQFSDYALQAGETFGKCPQASTASLDCRSVCVDIGGTVYRATGVYALTEASTTRLRVEASNGEVLAASEFSESDVCTTSTELLNSRAEAGL